MKSLQLLSSSTTVQQQPAAASPIITDEEGGPESSGCENERPGDHEDSSSDSEGEFDPQLAFDNWIVGLSLLDRKTLSVLLMETLQKRFNIKATAAALEAAWITGFNEKTIRYCNKEFMENRGTFKEERHRKYKRVCLKTCDYRHLCG